MKLRLIILTIFILTTSACCQIEPTPFTQLNYPPTPDLPKHPKSAKMVLDCTDFENLTVEEIKFCETMAEREATLRYHIETLKQLIDAHNEVLSD